jgi:hypothetical protein
MTSTYAKLHDPFKDIQEKVNDKPSPGDELIRAASEDWDLGGEQYLKFLEKSSGVPQTRSSVVPRNVFAESILGPTRTQKIIGGGGEDSPTDSSSPATPKVPDPSGAKGEVVTTYKGGQVRVYAEVEGRTKKWVATWQGPGMSEPKRFFSAGNELKAADFKEGTEGRAKLDELVGLKPADLKNLEYVWIGEEGKGRHVKIGTTVNSAHWFLLTPDGKGGFRTYHLGDQKPNEQEIQEEMRNGGYSYLFRATDDPKDFWQSANHDGRRGKLVTKIGDAEIWAHKEGARGVPKWVVTLHRPGKEPSAFYTFDDAPKKEDFEAGKPARIAAERKLGIATQNETPKGSQVQVTGIGESEVWVEERRVGRSGKQQWVARLYTPGHEPEEIVTFPSSPGTAHFGPNTTARKELDRIIAEQKKKASPAGQSSSASERVITPPSLVNQSYVGTTDDWQAKVLAGQLRGSDKWYVVTPKAEGGFHSYELKEVKVTNGQLSDETKARIRKMIEGGAFSRVWMGSQGPKDNPFKIS